MRVSELMEILKEFHELDEIIVEDGTSEKLPGVDIFRVAREGEFVVIRT